MCARLKSNILLSKGTAVQRHFSDLKGLARTENITTNWKESRKREIFASLFNNEVAILGRQVM